MTGPDLFLTEALSKYQKVNLLAIMIEHMNTVILTKDGKHGLAYGFWLNGIFSYFNIKCGLGKTYSVKQVFNVMTLEDNEYIPRKSGAKSKSIIADLIDVQIRLMEQLEKIAAIIA